MALRTDRTARTQIGGITPMGAVATAAVAVGAALMMLFAHTADAAGLGIHTVTWHDHATTSDGAPYHSVTPGLYVRTDAGLTLGVLSNSIGRISTYAGWTWHTDEQRPISAALTAGGITGYTDRPVRPLLIPSLRTRLTDTTSVRVLLLPKGSPKSAAAVSLAFEVVL